MRVVVFCEAEGDFRTGTGLVDRVLHDEGPRWIADQLEAGPEATREIRAWVADGQGREFFDVHYLDQYVKKLRVLVPQGHFDGRPGAPDATMARTVFHIAREIGKREALHAVLLVRDMDDQGKRRRIGLGQAHAEAQRWARFAIVIGIADPMREAWVMAGFEAESEEERRRLDKLREELGFHVCEEAHRLGGKKSKRSAKRVLGELTGDDHEREARCWTHAPLGRLRARGEHSGLRAFLDEVKEHLVPLAG